jgi:hypothetical protein
MTHSDFKDWKSHPVTKAFFSGVNRNIEGLKDELSYQAGDSLRNDAIKVGAIQALRDVLETDWFEETHV